MIKFLSKILLLLLFLTSLFLFFLSFYGLETDYFNPIIQNKVSFNQEDLKLLDEKAKKILSEFSNDILKIEKLNKETLEPIINELVKTNETNFKGVGQPLRIVLTGSKFGPGIYDIISSLGKEEVQKRLQIKITW